MFTDIQLLKTHLIAEDSLSLVTSSIEAQVKLNLMISDVY